PSSEPPPDFGEEVTPPSPRRRPHPASADATRPLRPEEHRSSAFVEPRHDETARTLLDRALEHEPTPTPVRLPGPVEGVGDAPVPMFRFVAFFAIVALGALAGAAVWYFRLR